MQIFITISQSVGGFWLVYLDNIAVYHNRLTPSTPWIVITACIFSEQRRFCWLVLIFLCLLRHLI